LLHFPLIFDFYVIHSSVGVLGVRKASLIRYYTSAPPSGLGALTASISSGFNSGLETVYGLSAEL
jgi:hypothetical protein